MSEYTLTMRDDGGSEESLTLEAETLSEALAAVANECEDWVSGGSWGDDGASVMVRWTLTDDDGAELDDGSETVEVPPDHAALIGAAIGYADADICGDDPDDHDWTREDEGGCDQNPGVWSVRGTALEIHEHCSVCGLRRHQHLTGAQRNPGECDRIEYLPPLAD